MKNANKTAFALLVSAATLSAAAAAQNSRTDFLQDCRITNSTAFDEFKSTYGIVGVNRLFDVNGGYTTDGTTVNIDNGDFTTPGRLNQRFKLTRRGVDASGGIQ